MIRNIIEIALWVGAVEIGGRRYDLVAKSQDTGNEFDDAGSGDEMTEHTLDAADWYVVCVRAEDGFDNVSFDRVVFAGSGTVSADVVDVLDTDGGIIECHLDSGDTTAAVFVLVGNTEGIGGGAVADDFGKDFYSSSPSGLQVFEDDGAGTFGDDKTIAFGIERA